MTIIAEKDRETIRQLLDKDMVDDVELLFFTRPRSRVFVPGRQECQTCDETRELLEGLVSLSDKLSLSTHDLSATPEVATTYNVSEVPTVMLRRRNGAAAAGGDSGDADGAGPSTPPNVRFVGLPAGYEFSTLIADLVDLSAGRTDLSEAALQVVRAIDSPVHIQVFVTPT